MIGQSEKSGIEIKSEYLLTGHPVFAEYRDYLMVQIMHQKLNYSYPLKCVFLS